MVSHSQNINDHSYIIIDGLRVYVARPYVPSNKHNNFVIAYSRDVVGACCRLWASTFRDNCDTICFGTFENKREHKHNKTGIYTMYKKGGHKIRVVFVRRDNKSRNTIETKVMCVCVCVCWDVPTVVYTAIVPHLQSRWSRSYNARWLKRRPRDQFQWRCRADPRGSLGR